MNGLLELVADAYQRNLGNPARQLVGNGVRGLLGLDPADYADSFGMEAYRNAQALSNAPTPLAFAALPAAMVKGAKAAKAVKAAPRDEALETARKNAVKMLGLPENNTAMDRAKALGFDVEAYHGTNKEFPAFDRSQRGSKFDVATSNAADWFAADPTKKHFLYSPADTAGHGAATASDYAVYKGVDGANVLPVMIRSGNLHDTSMTMSNYSEPAYVKRVIKALESGKDGVVIRNVSDNPFGKSMQADIYGIFDPTRVRSRFAAFDPARVKENDLLGRADPALLALIAAGTVAPVAYGLLTSNKEATK